MNESEIVEISTYLNSMENEIIVVAISIIFGLVAIRLCLKLFKRLLLLSTMDNALVSFVYTSLNVLLHLSLVLFCFKKLSIPITSMIAVLSACGVAIGLAIQDSIANVANGLVMIGTHPFKVGDYVQIGTEEGVIEELRLMNTVLSTLDNRRLVLPNKTVFNSKILNFNTNSLRRLDFKFTVDYDTNLEKAIKVTEEACKKSSYVLGTPSPRIELWDAGASALEISAWCWIKSIDYWDAYFDIKRLVFDAYKSHGITIPFNQLTVSERKKTPVKRTVTRAAASEGDTLNGGNV
jgi:Small-conductance mechanosensitive channel